MLKHAFSGGTALVVCTMSVVPGSARGEPPVPEPAPPHRLFASPRLPADTMPTGLVAADFDGDDVIDLVVGGAASGVTIRRGRGDGWFDEPVDLFWAGHDAIACGDLDGDGLLDLVTAQHGDASLLPLRGRGDGTFQPLSPIALNALAAQIVVDDLDRDGIADLLTANPDDGTVSVALGIGAGAFVAPIAFAAGLSPVALAVGDLDGTGSPDVVVADANGNQVLLLRGDDTGALGAPEHVITAATPRSIALGDVDGDGEPEVAVAHAGGTVVDILDGVGTSFTLQQTETVSLAPHALDLVDVDGDELLDIVVVSLLMGTVEILPGQPGGLFGARRTVETISLPAAVAAVALDDDDRVDLAVLGLRGLVLHYGTDDGAYETNERVAGTPCAPALMLVDDDADDHLELFAAGGGGVGPSVINRFDVGPDGGLESPTTVPVGQSPVAVRAAHLDGDERLDLVSVNIGSRDVTVLHGEPDCSYATVQVVPTATNPFDAESVDFDGDGATDLVVALTSDTLLTMRNDGTGLFEEPSSMSFPTGFGVELGDVDGDGDVDLAGTEIATLLISRNDGTGVFGPPEILSTGLIDGGYIELAYLGDVNGDGVLDAIVLQASSLAVLAGEGDGTFDLPLVFPAGCVIDTVAVADVDGDGFVDIVAGCSADRQIIVLRGTEEGTFSPPQAFHVEVTFPQNGMLALAGGDLDRDGDDDLVLAGCNTGELLLVRNTVVPAPTEPEPEPEPGRRREIVWTDMIASIGTGVPGGRDRDTIEPGVCSCGVAHDVTDGDGDTIPDCVDQCPGQDDLLDTDTDGTPDCLDGCPNDPDKTDAGVCGCGTPDVDADGDTVPDCVDQCPEQDDLLDTDTDGTPDCLDGCPNDPDKTDAGVCGCGTPDVDADGDTVPDCVDQCPGQDDLLDTDTDGTPDCLDGCPNDPDKTDPGACGCGMPETPGCTGSAFLSTDFNRCALDELVWTTVDPQNDATFDLVGAGTDDAYLEITVPPGVDHNAWVPVNKAARAMQACADTDFQLEVKFDSLPTQEYQLQGVFIQQDEDTFVRADFYSTNSSLKLFAATFTDDVPEERVNTTIDGGQPLYLRVTRIGDDWTVEYGYDGQAWTVGSTFTHAMTVTAVGPFAGNTGASPPGFTAQVDYFVNTSAPLAQEDGPVPPDQEAFTVDVTTAGGDGVVWLTPDLPFYNCGDSVTLTALPDPGYSFVGWSGNANSLDNPLVIQITGDRSITANFLDDTVQPIITDVEVAQSVDSALVTWTTDLPADSAVNYGETAGYELGTISDPALVMSHSIVLAGLAPETTYHYQVSSSSESGAEATTVDLTFDTLEPGANLFGAASDDFNRFNIDGSKWTLIDPIGDATVFVTGVGTDDAALTIDIPEGEHSIDGVNESVRLMQTANNTDFDVRVKFLSVPTLPVQEQGLIIEQDDRNLVRINYYANSLDSGILSASHVNGVMTITSNQTISPGSDLLLRITRTGDDWELFYGFDESNWISVASYTRTMTVNNVGIWGGNTGAVGPAFTVVVDYFEVLADPIVFEDADTSVVNDTPPFIYHLETAALAAGNDAELLVTWDTDEASDSSVGYGLTTAYELGEVASSALTTSHQAVLGGLDQQQTYEIEARSTDASANTGREPRTVAINVSDSPSLDVWYGDTQRFGDLGIPQRWVNVLGNVNDEDGIASLTYSLNGGPELPLSIGPDNLRRIWGDGDFNVEIDFADLNPGTNQVIIRAEDNGGLVSISTVNVEYADGNVWPIPYMVDWSAVTDIHDVAQPVDGKWVLPVTGGVRIVEPAYDRLLAIGDVLWDNYEVTAPITVHFVDEANGFQHPSNGAGVGFLLRWTGHTEDGNQPSVDYLPFGAIAWFTWAQSGFDQLEIFLPPGFSGDQDDSAALDIGVRYIFKAQVTTLSGSDLARYRFKYWVDGETEPGWLLEATGSPGDLSAGSLLLIAHHVDATFGNVTVVPVPPE